MVNNDTFVTGMFFSRIYTLSITICSILTLQVSKDQVKQLNGSSSLYYHHSLQIFLS